MGISPRLVKKKEINSFLVEATERLPRKYCVSYNFRTIYRLFLTDFPVSQPLIMAELVTEK
jgi:hypothetical protein